MAICTVEVNWLGYLTVALMSGLKFMVGVGISYAMGLNFWEQFLSTTTGGILGVWFFTYLGDRVRAWLRRFQRGPSKPFPPPRWAYLWRKYGLWGVAFLTPPILSPPIGTAIALAFGTPRHHIIGPMVLAMVVWGAFFASAWQGLQAAWR